MQNGHTLNDCWNKIGVWGDSTCPELVPYVHCHNCPVYSQSAITLLDRPMPPDYLREWTALAAKPVSVIQDKTDPVLVFRLGSELLALPLRVCQEVTQPLPTHTLPFRKDGYILGLVNVRGELVISVSVRKVLGIADEKGRTDEKRQGQFERLVVVQLNNARFAFPASDVLGIHTFLKADVENVPDTLAKSESHYVKSLLPLNGESVGLLDDELLFYTLGKGLA